MDTSFLLVVALGIGASYLTYMLTRKETEEANQNIIERQKEEFSELIINRETRTNLGEYDEDAFWELVDRISLRSKSSYQNFLGLFRDYIVKLSAQELIEMDNLVYRLVWKNLNQDLYAASYILFKTYEIGALALLMNVFITRGRVFYNQAKSNPDLIIGKTVDEIDGRLLNDIIGDVYYTKTRKLIPTIEEDDIQIPGEKWAEKDLPLRFPALWKEFL